MVAFSHLNSSLTPASFRLMSLTAFVGSSRFVVCLFVCLSVGALDVTEGVGAAFGIPHVHELWEEVSRGHRSRSNSYRARSRTRSTRSTAGEVKGGGSSKDP